MPPRRRWLPPPPRRPAPSMAVRRRLQRRQDPGPQHVGAGDSGAGAQHEQEVFFEAGVFEARPTTLEVLPDLHRELRGHLALQVILETVQRLLAVDVLTHGARPPAWA